MERGTLFFCAVHVGTNVGSKTGVAPLATDASKTDCAFFTSGPIALTANLCF
jgi:hypothetical protein